MTLSMKAPHLRACCVLALAAFCAAGCGGNAGTDVDVDTYQRNGGNTTGGGPGSGGGGPGGIPLGPPGTDPNGPDLVVSAAVAPQMVLAGSAFLINITIDNDGPGIAPTNVPWRLYRDLPGGRQLLDGGTIDRLDPGDATVVSVNQPTQGLALGQLALSFVIDPTNLVVESDEDNNERDFSVDVVQRINN